MRPADAPSPAPFAAFLADAAPRDALRRAITAATRLPEPDCLPKLIEAARLSPAERQASGALARRLVEALRAKPQRGGVEALVQEFSLSSQEGIALMCLAEALLRIPDAATRDALIRDKLGHGDWRAHLGQSPSLFVNAATWGLVVTGKLTGQGDSSQGLGEALTKLLARAGAPVIRRGVDIAMRLMGEQFVTGQTIDAALSRARKLEAKGFRYSYDMLGEAAMNAADAARYLGDYEKAIHAIGTASAGRGLIEGPGISIKLSALHPRYARAQRARVLAELLPRLQGLAQLARRYDIGLNIDAEEADRLELSLELLEGLCQDPALAGWNGIGFVVQAYQKRAPYVLDCVIDMARRSGRRMMVRLVKGAYWDSEIKRAQLDGLADFPVYTRKIHTDVSYLACARKLLAAPDAIFPQFATHNALTLAAIHSMADPARWTPAQYEFQCLHGMGEPLYEEVVGAEKLNRPCRIYAPVGTHETLLAYLVRRLLENGANTSFVNRIHDKAVPVAALLEDPVEAAAALSPVGRPHDRIAAPPALFADRRNARGFDLADEDGLAMLASAMRDAAATPLRAAPMPPAPGGTLPPREIRNPADAADLVGHVEEAGPAALHAALERAEAAAPAWAATPAADRAALLERAADLMEARAPKLFATLIREAGKSLPNAVSELREAVDFLRYYATQARALQGEAARPLGPVLCISPWNFPLAIFTGQVAAALAAGNVVLAKPAEETPLVAAQAIALLHEAGLPEGAVQLLPGEGEVGAALVGDARVQGVMFTGSTEVAQAIHRSLAQRLGRDGRPVPLIAETGGQNAMIVDSSALPEQVVADVLASAFDSAGQRCSALRVLCLQEEAAERILTMLRGAMAELSLGRTDALSTDIGPVISEGARAGIEGHIAAMRAAGRPVHALPLPEGAARGHFVAPTLIELDSLSSLTREVFGPVLHVLRWRREALPDLLRDIASTGYALTFGLHTRLDETVAALTEAAPAGNVYVNRNIIGAVVGVQPFGGHALSGTGPKAGGPLYLRRLMVEAPAEPPLPAAPAPAPAALGFRDWLAANGQTEAAAHCAAQAARSRLGLALDLPGPVGERNRYLLQPRGTLLCRPVSEAGLWRQLGAALATGNRVALQADSFLLARVEALPEGLRTRIAIAGPGVPADCDAVLAEAEGAALLALAGALAAAEGAVRPLLALSPAALAAGADYPLELLLAERSISINTAAAGGNASLMRLEA
ncbi:trifunctional transcriptional regulator/proline dehydrogenase/L-glutamate gamma-semialdehyde dehydrogenase [Pseudoroseomonas cervicalis]|uniref:trifunctional transcriptional regulator/proline dehydrogenase/L-glutamate gamma-semialdehyde dehydrogenase n=1 Tax=Teichococcus cervicalis TaxID=204525 RepID=UPI00278A6AD6|nr:trifunctional transcriptional regulator/proline dehydrogenase/L-glutamate gamma-semialdehyde dehydrogenase [Pseudoroseomonas cervicalis]MDQ1077491.1 RHH-type proline utilization regulon transcriptional repressor/proline dehydrogenase/delta 1-pyrroline-5-carboxylate dehydrogenase [Pseudoroseomonas cervicalis]